MIIRSGQADASPHVSTSQRLLAIDGLRGVAALSVVIYHLSGHGANRLASALPDWLTTVFEYGFLGVPIFFVLSGFVITASIDAPRVSARYLGRFALRRSLRLDPAYWAAILLALILLVVKDDILHMSVEYPSGGAVFFHAVYLQDILGVSPQISPVFWTLCLEIQFYLFFICSLYVLNKVSGSLIELAHTSFLCITGIASILLYTRFFNLDSGGWFLPFWHFFVLGALSWKALNKGGWHATAFGVVFGVEILRLTYLTDPSYTVAALATAGFIVMLGLSGRLGSALGASWLQFLGLISYSLYLTHADIGWKAISVLLKIPAFNSLPASPILAFAGGVAISIFFAYIFYLLIEKPSLYLSRKIRYAD